MYGRDTADSSSEKSWREEMKNVIHIFGVSGSGITTLVKRISDDLGFNHLESGIPIIIEGDFLHPKFMASFDNV